MTISLALVRRYLVWQHRWTGLAMTAFLVTVGLTGAMLAYKMPIERLVNPELFAAPKPGAKALDLGTLAEKAEANVPEAKVAYFYYDVPGFVSIRIVPRANPATGKPYELDFDHLFLDPYTGAVVGRRNEYGALRGRIDVIPFIYRLHTSLLLGDRGSLLLGIVALVWTLDCFVGLYLTFPAGTGRFWSRWSTAWRIQWKAKAFRLNFDLHRAGGLWLWIMLLVFAWSSVMFNLRPVYQTVTGAIMPYQTDEQFIGSVPAHLNEQPRLGWREAQARGDQLMAQQAAIHGFTVRRPSGLAYIDYWGVYSYTVESTLDFRRRGTATNIWIDGDTGELRLVALPNGEHVGNTVTNWLWALHYGDIYGFGWYRFLVFAVGLVLILLPATGVYIWWKKRLARTGAAMRRRLAQARGVS